MKLIKARIQFNINNNFNHKKTHRLKVKRINYNNNQKIQVILQEILHKMK